MDNIQKQEFTRRISNSNRGELIVIIYDIFYAYANEAQRCYEKGDHNGFLEALRKSLEAVIQLRDGLNFQYEIARELYPLYQFAVKQISSCFYKNNIEGLMAAKKILNNLYAGFSEVAKQDKSEPLMKHAQQIVAGMTYQKGNLTETIKNADSSRGFLC